MSVGLRVLFGVKPCQKHLLIDNFFYTRTAPGSPRNIFWLLTAVNTNALTAFRFLRHDSAEVNIAFKYSIYNFMCAIYKNNIRHTYK